MVNWVKTTSVTEVRSFLGLAGYCRLFVKGFSIVAAPFTQRVNDASLQHGMVMANASRQLKRHELNYPIYDLELAAVVRTGIPVAAAFIVGNKLFVANAGDCRTILCRAGHLFVLSKDHVASCLEERERVISAGEQVRWHVDNWRVGLAALQVCPFRYHDSFVMLSSKNVFFLFAEEMDCMLQFA
ncbi:hypothetical protein L3X38_009770 [Prunus dulcis]|uniref:PPM-type phosphatase domain-containing protein n=1 Tax=Prunus dulcis TaxID=3755 RepID=A0AAD4WEA5_PRUDU|nr:hypothetical protein L3X38_009770 [Prunus dulcis]